MLPNSGINNNNNNNIIVVFVLFANYRLDHFTGKITHTSKVCNILLNSVRFSRIFRETISRKSMVLFLRYFAKLKITSIKFRVSRNFENAVSQPPYLEVSSVYLPRKSMPANS